MRQQECVLEFHVIWIKIWFSLINVKTGRSDPPTLESLDQVVVLDQTTTRCVYDDGMLGEKSDRPGVKKVASCWCLRGIQAKELAHFHELEWVRMKHCVSR